MSTLLSRLERRFQASGFELRKFGSTDNRRAPSAPDGSWNRWYAARGGMLRHKFVSLPEAETWLERYEMSHSDSDL